MRTRYLFSFLVLVASLLYYLPGKSQGTSGLRVIAMPGFPELPADTAYEGQLYTYQLTIVNTTNFSLSLQSISFFLKVDSISTSLTMNPATGNIQPGDTVTTLMSQFNFTQPQFKLGSNIVVVWPVVNGLTVPIDTFNTNVYFIPFNSLGNNDLIDTEFQVYPIPAQHSLALDIDSNRQVEYVRIFNPSGQLVADLKEINTRNIDISFLDNGFYVLEVNVDGSILRRKILKR